MVESFSRKASGLVRSVSARDVLIYNLGIINLGFGLTLIFQWGVPFYSGANLFTSTLIVALFCIIQSLTYYFFSVVFPRAGGEYVFISRAMHPALGFAFSFNTTIWNLFYTAWAAANFASLGLSALFITLGMRLNNASLAATSVWLQSPAGMFLVGTILILIMTAIFILGMRPYLKVQVWTFALAVLGLAAIFIVLLTTSRHQFTAAFNAFAQSSVGDNAYERVIAIARDSGWKSSGFSWSATIAAMVWPFFPLAYSFQSASFGSEVRRVERSQLIGMPGSVAIAAGAILAMIALANRVMGHDFLAAIGWNAINAPQGSTQVTPWFHLLASLPSGSIIIVLLITVGFAMWTQFWVGGDLIYATRIAFAWALDRVVPESLSKVNAKLRTPVNSIILCTIISEIFLALYCFTPWLTTVVGILAMSLTFLMVGVAAAVFPFTRPEMYKNSPVARFRIGPIPVMSILGAITAIFMAFMDVLMFNDQLAVGPKGMAVISVLVPLFIGFAIFFIGKFIQKKRGIDISLAYKEIPIE